MKKLIFVGGVSAMLMLAGCASPATPQVPAAVTVTAPMTATNDQPIAESQTSSDAPTTIATTAESVEVPVNPTTAQSSPAPAVAPALMPNVVCLDLQQAQDTIQAAGVFFSRSDDATGQGRAQVMDRNWIVVAQTPAAGAPVGELEAVLSVVKDDEPNPC